MSLMGLLMASYGGLLGIPSGLTRSTDHPSGVRSLVSSIWGSGFTLLGVWVHCLSVRRGSTPLVHMGVSIN